LFFLPSHGSSEPLSGSRQTAGPDQYVSLPEQEIRFCEITYSAGTKYFDLARKAKTARDNRNGILESEAQKAMTAIANERNMDISNLLQQTGLSFESWVVDLLEIEAPNETKITFSVSPSCSKDTIIHISAPAKGPHIATLSTKQKGDTLIVSGRFDAREAGSKNQKPVRLEGSITERGSMEEPEYNATLR